MPVTPKLSRKFYETLGDDVANVFVEWFNQVDLAYRGELRELNEINFARFDAKLEQRLSQFDAKLEQRLSQFEAKLDHRIADLESRLFDRFGPVDTRFAQIDGRFAQIDGRFAHIDATVAQCSTKQELAEAKSDLLKWMFLFWVGNVATTIGVAAAVVGFLRSS